MSQATRSKLGLHLVLTKFKPRLNLLTKKMNPAQAKKYDIYECFEFEQGMVGGIWSQSSQDQCT